MKKLTREIALTCIAVRLLYIEKARTRDDLKIIACSGRCDLDFLWELGLITTTEKIQHECELIRAVQKRLADMMPVRLAALGGQSIHAASDEQLAMMIRGELHG